MENPERFDPSGAGGTLIDSEHRARYHFGSQVVAGKEVLDASCGIGYGLEILSRARASAVTGVDVSAEAIAAATERFGEYAAALVEADLRELPFEDDSFDVVVSFETIEHVEEPEKALAELCRVLRPDGVLVISSPNPDAYVGDNEHHVHEFRPAELRETVGGLLKNIAGFRQDAWLGSAIRPFDEDGATPEVLRTASGEDEAPYSIVAASDAALPELHPTVEVGDTFDVRWWSEQVENHRRQIVESNAREDQAVEREMKAGQRLQETSEALLAANRELAQVPVLQHRLESLEELHNDIAQRYNEMLGSTSWKITAPLRRRGRSS
ncbi:MAG TPA: methyltransferase domain-containing protein [Solirubrobacterales bacterium]|jgi:ubiquinone/menaquinone biosynthesis C-methylase UbiE|nr:methyltransferase domain-containing protein [Solirubrobacterales bacterium]